MFVAEKGKGAFLNQQRIRVAARRRLNEAVVACGLPHHGRGDIALAQRETGAMQQQVAGLRRFGAAALDLAWVAGGRLDGYWERDLKPWDMAAGLLLVREAGGFVSDCAGGSDILGKGQIVAANETIQKEMLRVLDGAAKT
jgi:myo-inositol-1(or 4)-monophosphatase